MKRKIAMGLFVALLAGVLLAGCNKKEQKADKNPVVIEEGESERTVDPEPTHRTYVDEHGLKFFGGTSFTTKGVRYHEEHPEDYEVIDVEAEITEITVEDAKQEGYQTIMIQAERRGETWADFSSGDPESNNRLRFTVPGFFICDMYTGRIVPFGEVSTADGTTGVQLQTDLEWGGKSYSISYLRETQTEFGEWSGDYHPFTVYGTYAVTVPKDYDGLAVLMTPRTEYENLEEDGEDGMEEYILDEWKEDSYLLRVSDLMELLEN